MTPEEEKELLHKFKEMDIAPEGFFPTFKAGYKLAMSEQESKFYEVIQWLNEEINYLKKMEDAQQLARDGHTKLFVLKQVKEKFLSHDIKDSAV